MTRPTHIQSRAVPAGVVRAWLRGMGTLVLVLGALLVGCDSISMVRSDDGQMLPDRAGAGLVNRTRTPIPDVPMPVGFVLLSSKSHASVVNGERNVTHVYQGRATYAETVEFYRRLTPASGWRLARDVTEVDEIVMGFAKGRETLELRISHPRDVATVKVLLRTPGQSPGMGGPAEAFPGKL